MRGDIGVLMRVAGYQHHPLMQRGRNRLFQRDRMFQFISIMAEQVISMGGEVLPVVPTCTSACTRPQPLG